MDSLAEHMEVENEKFHGTMPNSARKLPDSERLATLAQLEKSKAEVKAIIGRLPIGNRYKAIEDRERELYQQLDEIEESIKMFSQNEVFIEE